MTSLGVPSPTLDATFGRPAREPSAPRERAAAQRARATERRLVTDRIATIAIWGATAIAVLPLVLIIGLLVVRGASALSLRFFTAMPDLSATHGGGIANAIAGTGLLVGLAALIGVPIGVGAGLHVAMHPTTRLSRLSRYLSDVLNGVPSIVIGVFAWELFVRPAGHFSALAGSIALAVLLIPLVSRTTETVVSLVPRELTEAALALGFPVWRTAVQVVLRTALPGIATGALVAVARIAGETAPLLFTAFGNAFWSL
ncbi:MAG: phosphate ABC transporter permease PstA, partial [Gemmatimonadaceae bacterium]|nr:phosphate ABC transporter permease PstA [Gemmatimonadaceae bacterium]